MITNRKKREDIILKRNEVINIKLVNGTTIHIHHAPLGGNFISIRGADNKPLKKNTTHFPGSGNRVTELEGQTKQGNLLHISTI